MTKLCVVCKHICIDDDPGYSELTPGDGATISCLKGKWQMYNNEGTKVFRKNILQAGDCLDFEHVQLAWDDDDDT